MTHSGHWEGRFLGLKREDAFPVVLHADDDPSLVPGLVVQLLCKLENTIVASMAPVSVPVQKLDQLPRS